MIVTEERLKIAVFVDFDNIEIGVKTTLNAVFDIGTILEAIKERGEVITKIAYGDWTRAGDYSRLLTQHAIRMVQRNLTPGGDKNGADINLALDALEMALTHPHINAYVIVGGDSDFLSLVEKLKQYDKTVFVVGGRAFTSVILQRNCHEFIAYENLVSLGQTSPRRHPERGRAVGAGSQAVSSAFPLVRRALKVLSEREVTPQLGLLKSTLLQLDSTFSEKNYGASSFRDFAEKLAQTGLVRLYQSGRNLLVEIKDVEPAVDEATEAVSTERVHGERGQKSQGPEREGTDERPTSEPTAPGEALAAQQAEAVALLRRVLESPSGPLRWPMYVRNVKQLIRAADNTFDERRYGFGGILDLLRGAQREGLLRLERDRQGVLRVFQGGALQRPPVVTSAPEAADLPTPPLESLAPVPLPDTEPVVVPEPAPVGVEESAAVVDGERLEVPVAGEAPGPAEAPPDAEKPRRRRGTSSATGRKPAGPRKPRTPRPRVKKEE
jgi:uncharacterized LabA/DUF88 family protein